MKKLAIIGLFLSLAIGVSSQVKKGKMLIGGNMNFSNSSDNIDDKSLSYIYSSNSTSFGIIPNVGYFLSDKIAIGVSMGYNYSFREYEYTFSTYYLGSPYNIGSKRVNSDFLVGPFIRYYKTLGDKIGIFGHLYFEFEYGDIKNESTSDTIISIEKGNSISFNTGIRLGITYLVTEKFSIEATLGNLNYIYQIEEVGVEPNKRKETDKGLNFSFPSIALGIQFYL